jgi:hypothetical protein
MIVLSAVRLTLLVMLTSPVAASARTPAETDKRNESTGKNDGPPDAVVEITFPKFAIGFTKAFLADEDGRAKGTAAWS